LANQQCVVIAVVIAYHPRFQKKKEARGVSMCFVGTEKRYMANLFEL